LRCIPFIQKRSASESKSILATTPVFLAGRRQVSRILSHNQPYSPDDFVHAVHHIHPVKLPVIALSTFDTEQIAVSVPVAMNARANDGIRRLYTPCAFGCTPLKITCQLRKQP